MHIAMEKQVKRSQYKRQGARQRKSPVTVHQATDGLKVPSAVIQNMLRTNQKALENYEDQRRTRPRPDLYRPMKTEKILKADPT